jgi:hypothetical protein
MGTDRPARARRRSRAPCSRHLSPIDLRPRARPEPLGPARRRLRGVMTPSTRRFGSTRRETTSPARSPCPRPTTAGGPRRANLEHPPHRRAGAGEHHRAGGIAAIAAGGDRDRVRPDPARRRRLHDERRRAPIRPAPTPWSQTATAPEPRPSGSPPASCSARFASTRQQPPVFIGIAPHAPPRPATWRASPTRRRATSARQSLTSAPSRWRAEHAPGRPALLGGTRERRRRSQTLTWKVRNGNWRVIVMNADGTRRLQRAEHRRDASHTC